MGELLTVRREIAGERDRRRETAAGHCRWRRERRRRLLFSLSIAHTPPSSADSRKICANSKLDLFISCFKNWVTNCSSSTCSSNRLKTTRSTSRLKQENSHQDFANKIVVTMATIFGFWWDEDSGSRVGSMKNSGLLYQDEYGSGCNSSLWWQKTSNGKCFREGCGIM
ncbi:unnamed protein product [Cuscuta campestris]|uniref:Uncharacterized protein n=1 Tax=Cuscuta campestris TaxID=132261 RepID=A0A484K9F5_9ASTE|nr:unnamed protein product [Cuscuta campestris]